MLTATDRQQVLRDVMAKLERSIVLSRGIICITPEQDQRLDEARELLIRASVDLEQLQ